MKNLKSGMMYLHITIIALGSRGDVQPYLALAKGLIKTGYSVRLVTHAAFEILVRSYAIDFFPLDDDSHEFFQSKQGQKDLEAGANALLYIYRLARMAAPRVDLYMERCREACQDTDAIVVTYMSFLVGYSTAEKLKKPLIASFLQPALQPTEFIPITTAPHLPQSPPALGKTVNYQSYLWAGKIFWWLFAPAVNRARQKVYQQLPLPKKPVFEALPSHVALILYAYSPLLVPRPPDWGETTHVTGFWTLDHPEDWQPDPALVDFLQAGPAPVYIGFGSMSSYRPAKTVEMIEKVLMRAQLRGVVLVDKALAGEQKLSETMYTTNGVPHDWLFPQMRTIVHHGGAGTTAASLRAGIPTIVVAHIVDQQFWGSRVADLGAGPKPLARRRLSTKRLANVLSVTVNDQVMQRRAAEVGAQLRQENGVEQAVKAIDSYITNQKERQTLDSAIICL